MRQQDVHDELRARLHEAAGAHAPDRARILARVERGMAGPARPGHRATRPRLPGWVRVATATAAVAGVLAVGGYAVASAVKDDPPARRTVAASPTPAPSPSHAATTRPPAHSASPAPGTGGTRPSRTPGTPASRTPAASARPPAITGEQDGPLWSDGSVDAHSNDFWAQSDVTLKTSRQLTSLTVRLKVRLTEGVSSAGAWRSLPEQDFTQQVREREGFLVYTWTLKDGRRVPAGTWEFAGQYQHARGGRDAGDDRYTITAAADGRPYAVTGGFARHDGGGS